LDHKDKLEFLHKIAKLGVQHFDGGGLVGGLGSALGISNNFTAGGGPTSTQLTNAVNTANQAVTGTQQLQQMTQPGAQVGVNNQNALAAQLQAMTLGQGPNPALAQLNQATGQNVANQAAMAAGQRGASQNVGLLARQAAQTGAATQQNAVGQAASQMAQQQIAAQNNLANLSAQQVGQAGQAAGAFGQTSGNVLGTLENANAAANTANANIAGQNAQTNSGLLGGIGAAIGLAKGGKVQKMAAGGISTGSVSAPTSGSWVGNFLTGQSSPSSSAASSGGGTLATAVGNVIGTGAKKLGSAVSGLFSSPSAGTPTQSQLQSIQSDNEAMGAGPGMNAPNTPANIAANNAAMMAGPSTISSQDTAAGSLIADNQTGPVPSGAGVDPNDPTETITPANQAQGGRIRKLDSKGDVVKATGKEKAVKPGNSYANDKVPALLSEGEVVIDRDTLADPGPVGQMARSIRSHIEARNKRK
jgi:hypothetical protein